MRDLRRRNPRSRGRWRGWRNKRQARNCCGLQVFQQGLNLFSVGGRGVHQSPVQGFILGDRRGGDLRDHAFDGWVGPTGYMRLGFSYPPSLVQA